MGIALITNNILSDSGTALTSVITGSGTTNYLPKFTGTSAIGNSAITDDGTNVTLLSRKLVGSTVELTTSTLTDALLVNNGSGRGIRVNNSGAGYGVIINNDTVSSAIPFLIQKSGVDKIYFTDAGAGNFASSLTASSFVKSGGTSAQFLKADGSIDSSTYLTTSSASSTYLAKTGGTLTGSLNGTTAVFSGAVWGQTGYFSNTTADNALAIFQSNASYHAVTITNSGVGGSALYATGTVTVVGTLTATGVLTAQSGLANGSGQSFTLPSTTGTLALTSQLSSYLPLAGGTLTGGLIGTFITARAYSINEASAQRGGLYPYNVISGSGTDYSIGLFSESSLWFAAGGGITKHLNIASTGAATFSSSVTATQMSINTTSTYTRLQVSGGHASVQSNSTAGTDGAGDVRNAGFGFRHASADLISALINTTAVADWGLNLHFNTRQFNAVMPATPAMTITAGQNVGIGTTSPTTYSLAGRHLELNDAGGGYAFYHCNTTTVKSFYASNESALLTALFTFSNHPLTFGTNNTERMRITSGGNVGIGETNPGSKLSVKGTSTTQTNIYAESATSSYTSSNIVSLSYTASGTGWNHFLGYSDIGSTVNIKILGNGNIQNANNSYGAISDIKLKENISDATGKLSDLLKVKIRNYNFIGSEDKQLGVIAQELEEVFPSMIDISPDRDVDGNDLGTVTKSVKYSVFVPMLVKAVQELKAELDTLKNK